VLSARAVPGRSLVILILPFLSSCGEIGVSVEVSAQPDVPPLDSLHVQVSQGSVIADRSFSLVKGLPASVAVVTRGMTRGRVTVIVDGLSGGAVLATGSASAELEPASSGPRVAVVLARTLDAMDGGMCLPKACADLSPGCGVVDAGCGVAVDCGPCCTPQLTPQELCLNAETQCGTIRADDGCGMKEVDCGGCGGGQVCRGGACCTPMHDALALCTTAGFGCGRVRLIDQCGDAHMVDCGGCAAALSCDMSDRGSECGACLPEDDAHFCWRLGATCGSLTANDNCGATRTVGCGGCEAGVTCGASVANQCECLPLLAGCASGNQCCNGTCGDAGLCCMPLGLACADDSDCCEGSCALGFCEPYADAGIGPDDGGVL
jgi:hypothetical protein